MVRIVGRMAKSIVNLDFTKIKGRETFQAGHIDAELVGVRSALVVGVDAAIAAEMMFGSPGIESVSRECVRPLQYHELIGS